MAVVSAQMSCAVVPGPIGKSVFFPDRQGVRFAPEHTGRSRPVPPEKGEHPVSAYLRVDFVGMAGLQKSDEGAGRFLFISGCFRVLVNPVPELGYFLQER